MGKFKFINKQKRFGFISFLRETDKETGLALVAPTPDVYFHFEVLKRSGITLSQASLALDGGLLVGFDYF